MEGFIIASIDEESQEPANFWEGTNFTEEANEANFYSDRSAARADLGSVQRQFNDQEFKLLKVRKTLEITE